MDCPVCNNPMITFELAEVEVDNCVFCGGIWLDAGELEMLLGNRENAKELLRSFRQAQNCTETPRKCPICMKKMLKVLAGPQADARLIDKCPKGHGLWFDKGELRDIINLGSFDKENKVAKLLGDIFSGQ